MSGVPPHILRRRIVALLVLVAALLLVVVVVARVLSGEDGPQTARAGETTATTTRAARRAARRAAVDPTAARDMGEPGPARPVPILMYHVTTDPPADAPFPDLYVRASEFADQMQALHDAGYVAVTQQEVWDFWHRGGPLPARAVVVSIDDGYHSNFANARPVLRRLGWPAVLNLKVGNLHEPTYGLTDGQVKQLIADGWEIDSHTIDHPDLTTVDAATLAREIGESRRRLQKAFGVPVNFFCYPAGRYDDAVIAAVEQAGYLAATTVNPGLAEPDDSARFALNRVRVNAGVSGASLVGQLQGLGA
ncbi:polysaccharide deacetylase family protein [Conexibacter stalactiti]|uniref:Polysaccharide deacetylase family protein n=1 Tax=Conexibacter stalactiti TaxID=1940611 RepID=A0ABU4HHX1_9ACTN|nr:polysaccharide deacetylase family protein [Conexibacter stalactiti]MDW5592903.1 polysaccharide deacetylase family protein [Conexibacter stalactiti]MEC5033544.1 polysaccharide deacetylase family protein [Conexibacter stalactiti]